MRYVCTPSLDRLIGSVKGRSVIVVGAGPSLGKSREILQLAQVRHTVIVAVDSALPILSAWGVQPDYVCAIDCIPDKAALLAGAPVRCPLLVAPFIDHALCEAYQGPVWVIPTDDILMAHIRPQSKYRLNDDLFSVIHLAFAWARDIGGDPIHLVGVDLAFPGGRTYAGQRGRDIDWNSVIWIPNVTGGLVPTYCNLAQYVDTLRDQIKRSGVSVVNHSNSGALLE